MRLFFAVDLDASSREAVGELATAVRAQLDPALARSGTWVATSNLHVTLRFLGDVGDEDAAALARAFSEPMGVAPFSIEIGGLGAFPHARAPRVLWVGLRTGDRGLQALYDEVQARLTGLRVPPEPRAYHPHITLARFKADRMPRGAGFPKGCFDVADTIAPMRVGELTLFESHLSSQGSRYVPRFRTRLVPH